MSDLFKNMPSHIIIDFTNCRYLSDIHQLLKEKFGFPDYYGENWDALWDCWVGLFYDRGKFVITIKGVDHLDHKLKEACGPMLEIFSEIEQKEENVRFLFEA